MLSKEDDVAVAELEVIIHCESHFSAYKDGCVCHWAQCTKTITKASHAYQSCIDWFLKRMRETERPSGGKKKSPPSHTTHRASNHDLYVVFTKSFLSCVWKWCNRMSISLLNLKAFFLNEFFFFFLNPSITSCVFIGCFRSFKIGLVNIQFGVELWELSEIKKKRNTKTNKGCDRFHFSPNSLLTSLERVTGLEGKMREDVKKITKLRMM